MIDNPSKRPLHVMHRARVLGNDAIQSLNCKSDLDLELPTYVPYLSRSSSTKFSLQWR